ncbi:Transcriptional regulator of various polyols utilization, AraC family [Rhodovastum atsumiense]|uniref:AraC family transcriptional regulator n=1 Tax=Rhodovastum atsumiense TaxID=504468 RepID=A0A5M6IR86_9PROT|nr:AraC family transcriptional regulator [Rhodovastum atsumiense]KAA5610691.1 AraC family transcriptional regulator [Rhodovastum atsumiense]CAH2603310.1 Transcriptional regulator of various polyols utilization, AraC family [Rhodovastum atsumiense]
MKVKPLCEVIGPSLEGTFRVFQHDYPFPYSGWHFHPEYEIHLIRKSRGLCYVGTHAGPFDVGQVILTGPNLPHMWVTDGGPDAQYDEAGLIRDRDLVLQFSGRFAERCIATFSDCAGLQALVDAARAGVQFSVPVARKAWRIMHSLLDASGLERVGIFFTLLHVLAGDAERRLLSVTPPNATGNRPKRLASVLEYIAANYNRHSLSCNELAAMEKMTPSAFSRFFERNISCSCNEYINRLRVYRACQLLIETDAQVTAIGYDSGYSTISTFNRNFVRFMGASPSEFRAQRRLPRHRPDLPAHAPVHAGVA